MPSISILDSSLNVESNAKSSKSPVVENIPSNTDLLDLYNNGSKSDLRSTKKIFLLALCVAKFGATIADKFKDYDKQKLLDTLHEAVSAFFVTIQVLEIKCWICISENR